MGGCQERANNMRGRGILIGRNNINIRLATIDDVEQLVNLRIQQQHEVWGSEYADYDNDFNNRTLGCLDDLLRWKDGVQPSKGVMFIAEIKGEIVTTCGLQKINILPQCNDNGKHGFIFNVFTIEEFRKQGIQSLLIEKALNCAKEMGITEIKLETDSEIAINLYKKYGFKHDELFMSKLI